MFRTGVVCLVVACIAAQLLASPNEKRSRNAGENELKPTLFHFGEYGIRVLCKRVDLTTVINCEEARVIEILYPSDWGRVESHSILVWEEEIHCQMSLRSKDDIARICLFPLLKFKDPENSKKNVSIKPRSELIAIQFTPVENFNKK